MLRQFLAAALVLVMLVGSSRGADSAKAGSANSTFEKLKGLAGTWVEAGPDAGLTQTLGNLRWLGEIVLRYCWLNKFVVSPQEICRGQGCSRDHYRRVHPRRV